MNADGQDNPREAVVCCMINLVSALRAHLTSSQDSFLQVYARAWLTRRHWASQGRLRFLASKHNSASATSPSPPKREGRGSRGAHSSTVHLRSSYRRLFTSR
jgi:hypothetical protein